MPSESQTTDVWLGVLGSIRGKVTAQQFETWFSGIQPGDCTEDTLELTVANQFSKEWLKKKYGEIILSAAEQANGGRRPTLRIRVREREGSECSAGSAVARLKASSPKTSGGEDRDEAPAEPASRILSADDRVSSSPAVWLNPDYRFDTFVGGPGNELPLAAARSVGGRTSKGYNPIFIHGGVGLGKSHLLQAIAHKLTDEDDRRKVLFVPCEHFVNHFISAVERHDLDAFRGLYRGAETLIVDDVHLLAQKERTQEEFLHTFNHLYNSGRQIVLAADAEPGAIPYLSERLSSRFRWGLVCGLDAPEYATREGIVGTKSARLGVSLPREVVRYLAENVRTNVRELEGAVTRIIGHASLSNVPPSLDLAQTVLKDVVSSNRRRVTIEHIAQVVTERFGVKLPELQGKRRTQAVVVPRQLCMYIARRLTGHSLETIGGYFGGRDHSTVLYSVDRTNTRIQKDDGFRKLVEETTSEIIRRVDR